MTSLGSSSRMSVSLYNDMGEAFPDSLGFMAIPRHYLGAILSVGAFTEVHSSGQRKPIAESQLGGSSDAQRKLRAEYIRAKPQRAWP